MTDARNEPATPSAVPSFWLPKAQRASRLGRFAFGLAISGLITTLLGPILDVLSGLVANATPGGVVLLVAGILFHIWGAVALVAAAVSGIVVLAWGARPRTKPVLSIVALPVAAVLLFIELFVIFLATT